MTHLTNVIEEEKETLHQLYQTNLVTKEMRDDFLNQAMIKAVLVVIEEIEKELYVVDVDKVPSIQDEAYANMYDSKAEAFWYGESIGIKHISEALSTLKTTLTAPKE